MAYINGIDEEKRIINSIGAGLSLDDKGKITADVLQSELDAKQATIDSSNRLDANLIGDNGFVSNTEYGQLNGISANIQGQLDDKQPEITTNARLDLTLCGAGNVDNQDFAKLTLASDLTDTIKNILTQPSTKLIQAGTGLSYNTSTTPPTLNASTMTITGNRVCVSDGGGNLTQSNITTTELNRLDNISQNIQNALNAKLSTSSREFNSSNIEGQVRLRINSSTSDNSSSEGTSLSKFVIRSKHHRILMVI